MRYNSLFGFLLSIFVFIGCNSCVEVQKQPSSLDQYKEYLSSEDRAENALVRYITRRTVRIVIKCTVYDTRTNEVFKKNGKVYKDYDAGWGTGAIVYSDKAYSIIQTAEHVVSNSDMVDGHLIRKCHGFKIERRNIDNVIIETVSGDIKVIAKNKKVDLALLKVPYNFNVRSKFAKSIHLGQSIRVVGFPSNRFLKGKHLAYEKGWVGTVNKKGKTRWGLAAYFGNSGGAVWNQQGEIIGTVVSLGGFGTLLGSYIPQQNHTYGPNVITIKRFYVDNGFTRYLR